MPQTKKKKRLGILRGGKGKNYETSLKKGGDLILYFIENCPDTYKTVDVLVDRDGVWHFNGLPIVPVDLKNKIDLVWNTTMGECSSILDNLAIPHVSSSVFSSTILESKEMLREHMKKMDMPMPRSILLPVYQSDFDGARERYAIKKAKEVHEKFAGPWVIKSLTPDKSMGVHVAKTFNELVAGIEDGVKHGNSIIVEELIMGKIASLHSLAGFRGQDIYTFPLGNTYGEFSQSEKERLSDLAAILHEHMGINHYLKSDFVLNPRGKVYLLNVDSTPDLRADSHFHQVCGHLGVKAQNIVEHILERAI